MAPLPSLSPTRFSRFSTTEAAKTETTEKEAPPVHIGWDSHQPIEKAPDSLVRDGDGPEGNFPMRSKFEKMIREAQISITKAIEEIDGEGKFQEDCWTRANGGGGMSRVLAKGKVFEKAGVTKAKVEVAKDTLVQYSLSVWRFALVGAGASV